MLKFLFITNLIFFSTAFALDCNDLIMSTENTIQLKVLLNKSYYNATLEINRLADKDFDNHKFQTGSELIIGSSRFSAKSCDITDRKFYLVVELTPNINVKVEFDSLDSDVKSSATLTKEDIVNFLIPQLEVDKFHSQFKKLGNSRNYRKRTMVDDELEDRDSMPQLKKSSFSTQDDVEEDIVEEKKLVKDVKSIESKYAQSTSVESEQKDKLTVCGKIFQNGSGTYKFVIDKKILDIYVYSFDYIKHWYPGNSYLLKFMKSIPINILDTKERVLKSCSDKLGRPGSFLEYLTQSGRILTSHVNSIISVDPDIIGQNKFSLHPYNLDEKGVYTFYDDRHVSMAELTLTKPYNIVEEFEDPDNSLITLHYTDPKIDKATSKLVTIILRRRNHNNYYDMQLKFSRKSGQYELTPFKSFVRLKDKSDVLLDESGVKNSQVSDGKVYRQSLQTIIDKLELPSFGKINFCNSLFFPGKYRVEFNKINPINLNVTDLIKIFYNVESNEIQYVFRSNSNLIRCVHNSSGSNITHKDFINSVNVLDSKEYFVDKDIESFLQSNNQCLNLINPGSYKIYHFMSSILPFDLIIHELKSIYYSLMKNKMFVNYKFAELFNNKLFVHDKKNAFDVEHCYYFQSINYLKRNSPLGFKEGDKERFKFIGVERD